MVTPQPPQLDAPPERAIAVLIATGLPCPFACEEETRPYLYRPQGVRVWQVRHACGAHGPAEHDAIEAVRAWNERKDHER